MTQLSINGIDLPETKNGKYKCYEQELGENIRMISGRLVTEVRSSVRVIEYSYDYMGNDLMRRLLTALRSRSDLSGAVSRSAFGQYAERLVPLHQAACTAVCVFTGRCRTVE